MEEIQSDRGLKYVHNNYIYKCNKSVGVTSYYKCHLDGCRSRTVVTGDDVRLQTPHDHGEEEDKVQTMLFRQALRREAITNRDLQPRQIFDRVSER